jgi:hypothetical protein
MKKQILILIMVLLVCLGMGARLGGVPLYFAQSDLDEV